MKEVRGGWAGAVSLDPPNIRFVAELTGTSKAYAVAIHQHPFIQLPYLNTTILKRTATVKVCHQVCQSYLTHNKDVPRYGSTETIQYKKMANTSRNILARLKQTGVITSLGKASLNK